jgi:hypothetical protein
MSRVSPSVVLATAWMSRSERLAGAVMRIALMVLVYLSRTAQLRHTAPIALRWCFSEKNFSR